MNGARRFIYALLLLFFLLFSSISFLFISWRMNSQCYSHLFQHDLESQQEGLTHGIWPGTRWKNSAEQRKGFDLVLWIPNFSFFWIPWYYLGWSLDCFQFLSWTAKKQLNPMRFHFIIMPTNLRASSAKCHFLTKLKQRLFCRIVLTQVPLPRIRIRTFSFKSKTAFVSVVY